MNQQELLTLIYSMCITKEELLYALEHLEEWKREYEKRLETDHSNNGYSDLPLFSENKK